MQQLTAVRFTEARKCAPAARGDTNIHKVGPRLEAPGVPRLDRKHVLLAEDEPMLRTLVHELLHAWGYRVFSAGNGREALELADGHEGPIDLLISDVTMPEMNGPELAEKLNLRRPRLQVILLSGYSQTEIVLQRGWRFIKKPFQMQALKVAVEDSWNPRNGL